MEKLCYFSVNVVFCGFKLLHILVTDEEPTSGHHDVCSVGTLKGHLGEREGGNTGRSTVRPHFLQRLACLSGWQKNLILLLGLVVWMLHIVRAWHPGPLSGRMSFEFVNVGSWLANGDMALDSCALAVAEHRLIPARARSMSHQLRKADRSAWAPASQDQLSGGHAGVGVVSLGGAPLSAPSLVTPEFQEFFRLGRVMRVVLPAGDGVVVHLHLVYGYQGSKEDSEKLSLTDKPFRAVLAEAQVVCVISRFLRLVTLMLTLVSSPA